VISCFLLIYLSTPVMQSSRWGHLAYSHPKFLHQIKSGIKWPPKIPDSSEMARRSRFGSRSLFEVYNVTWSTGALERSSRLLLIAKPCYR